MRERDLIELLLKDCLVINTQKNYRIHTIAIENGSRDYLRLSNKWGDEKVPPIVTRKNDAPICPIANVWYLYQPREFEGGVSAVFSVFFVLLTCIADRSSEILTCQKT